MAHTVQFFAQQTFAAGSTTFQTTMPPNTATIQATITVPGGAPVTDADGNTYNPINGSIQGELYDSADGVTWRDRGGSTFVNGGGSAVLSFAGVQHMIRYVVTVVGGPTVCSASGSAF